MLAPWKKSYDQPRKQIKKQRHYFANKGPSSQGYGFSSGHVWMWGLDYKKSWAPKNWSFWTVVLEKTLERVPWTAGRSNQSILRKSVLYIYWKDWCWSWNCNTLATWWELTHWKRPRGKDWRQEEKGATEDEVAGWHHHLNGHEFEQALGVGEGQGGPVCCSPWGCKESDMTE